MYTAVVLIKTFKRKLIFTLNKNFKSVLLNQKSARYRLFVYQNITYTRITFYLYIIHVCCLKCEMTFVVNLSTSD